MERENRKNFQKKFTGAPKCIATIDWRWGHNPDFVYPDTRWMTVSHPKVYQRKKSQHGHISLIQLLNLNSDVDKKNINVTTIFVNPDFSFNQIRVQL